MRFCTYTLLDTSPDPVTGIVRSQTEAFEHVVQQAVWAEELGFDGFGVGERHAQRFVSSSPPVVLAHIAARTSRIRLLTTVTVLSLLDPVRQLDRVHRAGRAVGRPALLHQRFPPDGEVRSSCGTTGNGGRRTATRLSGISLDVPGLAEPVTRRSVERFFADVAPAVRAAQPLGQEFASASKA